MREWAFTARPFHSHEALAVGLVRCVAPTDSLRCLAIAVPHNAHLPRVPLFRRRRSSVFPDRPAMLASALSTAQLIAAKSPVAVQGTKDNLNFARDHGVDEALKRQVRRRRMCGCDAALTEPQPPQRQAVWNAAMLQTEDIIKAAQAGATGETPTFAKL